MEVKASCNFDFESVKALTYLTMFNKGNPKKKMLFSNILFGILLVVLILEIIILGSNSSLIFGAVVAFLGLFLNMYMWFLFPSQSI